MSEFFALVPAAGSSARMGSDLPKQYLTVAGQPLIYHALATLCANMDIRMVFVVLALDDVWFTRYDWSAFGDKLQPLYCGGATRGARRCPRPTREGFAPVRSSRLRRLG